MLTAALSENDSAGISIVQHWTDIPVGDYTADVSVRPAELDTAPPSMELSTPDLALVLRQLRLRVEVDIQEIEALETIIYTLTFDLPGVFEKTSSTPPELLIRFPAVTSSDLSLSISGGDIPVTAELIEPMIHELYDADPTLGHNIQYGIEAPPPLNDTVNAETHIYDDDSGSPDFRGAITVEVSSDSSQITVVMPGHFKVYGITNVYMDTDMEVRVNVAIERDGAAGKVCAKLSDVQAGDVSVSFAESSIYDFFAVMILEDAIADKINGDGTSASDKCIDIPTDTEVGDIITEKIVDFASNLEIPIFTPSPPSAGEVDITTFVPMTIDQKVLALQIAPLDDGTACDTPVVFAEDTGFAVAISKAEVTPILDSIVAANKGDHTVQGYDMTVDPLDGTLSDPNDHGISRGHIWVEGTATVDVDCWDSPEVDFSGPVYLVPHINPNEEIYFTADAGDFTADEPCCSDVGDDDIEALIEGEESVPIKLPSNFMGVGELNLTVSEARIYSTGIVILGSLSVITLSALHAGETRKTSYWFNEMAGGG
jgi:hypothetical protein